MGFRQFGALAYGHHKDHGGDDSEAQRQSKQQIVETLRSGVGASGR